MKQLPVIVEEAFVYDEDKHLTVMKTSLFFAGDGYTVYDCKGELLFRVDSYGPDARDKDEIVLMDAQGKCLLTVRRKVMLIICFSLISSSFFVLFTRFQSVLDFRNFCSVLDLITVQITLVVFLVLIAPISLCPVAPC